MFTFLLPQLNPYDSLCCIFVRLKDRKRSLSGKNDHNALWH